MASRQITTDRNANIADPFNIPLKSHTTIAALLRALESRVMWHTNTLLDLEEKIEVARSHLARQKARLAHVRNTGGHASVSKKNFAVDIIKRQIKICDDRVGALRSERRRVEERRERVREEKIRVAVRENRRRIMEWDEEEDEVVEESVFESIE